MEYIYAALLLNKVGKDINAENVKKVIEATGVKADEAKIKALIAALEGVNIQEAISKAVAVAPTAAPSSTGTSGGQPPIKKEEKKEEKKSPEEAAAGLSSLFG